MGEYNEAFNGFDGIAGHSFRQKERVLGAETTGYEPHMHDLYRKLAPELAAKYGGRTARDCVFFLGYIHAHRLGEGAAQKMQIDKRLIGWAFPKDDDINAQLSMSKGLLNQVRRILISERLLIVKKRYYNRSPKLYYLPFYEAYGEELAEYNDTLGRAKTG